MHDLGFLQSFSVYVCALDFDCSQNMNILGHRNSQLDISHHFPELLLVGANNKRKYVRRRMKTYEEVHAEAVGTKRGMRRRRF